jgi:CBS domain-containing protein
MQVRDAMAKTISTAHPAATIREVAEIMKREDCGFVPILRDDRLVGVVTDRDIVIRFCSDGASGRSLVTTPVSEIMTATPRTVQADPSLEDAAHVMAIHQVRRLPVLDGTLLVGILSYGNLEQAFLAHGVYGEQVTLGVAIGAEV